MESRVRGLTGFAGGGACGLGSLQSTFEKSLRTAGIVGAIEGHPAAVDAVPDCTTVVVGGPGAACLASLGGNRLFHFVAVVAGGGSLVIGQVGLAVGRSGPKFDLFFGIFASVFPVWSTLSLAAVAYSQVRLASSAAYAPSAYSGAFGLGVIAVHRQVTTVQPKGASFHACFPCSFATVSILDC